MPPVIDESRKKRLLAFEKSLAIRFRSLELLNLSFIHRSVINENTFSDCNERLEFLGDSILGAVAASELYSLPGNRNEGELARIKSIIVSEEMLAAAAKKIKIPDLLILGKGEENTGGREKKTLMADALEALIGAYYLDSGYKAVYSLVERLLNPIIRQVLEDRYKKDYKTLLQELCQRLYKTNPHYEFVKKTGPDHDRVFCMNVLVLNQIKGSGQGKTKKSAEQQAAQEAFLAMTSQLTDSNS